MFFSGLAERFQAVQDNFPESAKLGAAFLQEGLLAYVGNRYSVTLPQGPVEVIQVGQIGDSGNILKVRCPVNDKDYILKRMWVGQADDKPISHHMSLVSLDALQLLAEKGEVLPSLPFNPCVVQCFSADVFNTGRAHGRMFLMEYCEETLTSFVEKRGGILSAAEVLHVLVDISEGLQFLHGAKQGPLIHGAIEPDHIMRRNDGNWKLGGFGDMVFGESPTEPLAKTDIWQLGLLLFTLLFGLHPFGSGDEHTKEAKELCQGSGLAVPDGHPNNTLEGKLVVLMHWLLYPDERLRPTAKQVATMARHLSRMPPSKLMMVLPPPIQQGVLMTVHVAQRQSLCDGLLELDESDRMNLVCHWGEALLLNPASIPEAELKALLPNAVARVQELHYCYGVPPKDASKSNKESKENADAAPVKTEQDQQKKTVEENTEVAEKDKVKEAGKKKKKKKADADKSSGSDKEQRKDTEKKKKTKKKDAEKAKLKDEEKSAKTDDLLTGGAGDQDHKVEAKPVDLIGFEEPFVEHVGADCCSEPASEKCLGKDEMRSMDEANDEKAAPALPTTDLIVLPPDDLMDVGDDADVCAPSPAPAFEPPLELPLAELSLDLNSIEVEPKAELPPVEETLDLNSIQVDSVPSVGESSDADPVQVEQKGEPAECLQNPFDSPADSPRTTPSNSSDEEAVGNPFDLQFESEFSSAVSHLKTNMVKSDTVPAHLTQPAPVAVAPLTPQIAALKETQNEPNAGGKPQDVVNEVKAPSKVEDVLHRQLMALAAAEPKWKSVPKEQR